MSAVFKRLERKDAFISPYTAHKTFTFASSSFGEVGIEWKRGVSGSFPYNEEAITYAGIKHIMFDTYGQTSTEFNWTSSLGNQVNVLSIPRELYGLSIKPGSFSLQMSGSTTLTDDNGYVLSGSSTVGYISYSKGLVAFTAASYEELGTFNSSSISTLSFSHTQYVYAAVTSSLIIDPSSDLNPFEPGGSEPRQQLTLVSSSYDFKANFIFGAPDVNEALPTAPYLAPRVTLHLGGLSSSFFAELIDDTVVGKLSLDFNEDISHPIAGVVDLSNSGDYSQFDSIELEWKVDGTGGNVTHGFLTSGKWNEALYSYPNSSSNFEIIDQYTAKIDPVAAVVLGDYVQELSEIARYVSIFTSSSLQTNFFGGNYTASFQASEPILTHNYHCHIDPNEFNLSYNPSLQDKTKVSGSLLGLATGSEFRPYTTGVGLYNSVGELVAVGKLSEPTPILKDTHYTFVAKIDL